MPALGLTDRSFRAAIYRAQLQRDVPAELQRTGGPVPNPAQISHVRSPASASVLDEICSIAPLFVQALGLRALKKTKAANFQRLNLPF